MQMLFIFFDLSVLARFSLQEDDAHTLAVVGEPGLGKSALLAKLAQTLSHVSGILEWVINLWMTNTDHITIKRF